MKDEAIEGSKKRSKSQTRETVDRFFDCLKHFFILGCEKESSVRNTGELK
jgi:hypothetical protein